MNKINLVFGFYSSQPVGASDSQMERDYQDRYKTLIMTAYNHQKIPLTFYFPGHYLSWMERTHNEFHSVLRELIAIRQIEMLSGGYYEPVMPLVPVTDRVGQLDMMNTYIRKSFSKRIRGCWLPLMIWEPSMASSLKTSGIDYTFLNDSLFENAGLRGNELYSPCYTEDQGKTLAVFPVHRKLVKQCLNGSTSDVFDSLHKLQHDSDPVTVCLMLNSREFFSTREVQPNGECLWLNEFFEELAKNRSWINVIHPGKLIKQKPLRKKKVYFPGVVNESLMKWILPAESARDYQEFRTKFSQKGKTGTWFFGGHFRQILSKYPESNLLYSRMIYTHILVKQLRGDRYRKKTANQELWRAQSHFPFWHGPEGFLYTALYRHRAYQALIESEKIARGANAARFTSSLIAHDYDMDGEKEYIFRSRMYNAFTHKKGGVIVELDYMSSPWNYFNTLAAHKEFYQNGGHYDKVPRYNYLDHFLDGQTSLDSFRKGARNDAAFWDTDFDVTAYERDHSSVSLFSRAQVRGLTGTHEIELTKKYIFKDKYLALRITLKNNSPITANLRYACEFNLSFWNPERVQSEYSMENRNISFNLMEQFTGNSCNGLVFRDKKKSLSFNYHWKNAAEDIWSYPHVTNSEDKEAQYQCSTILPVWKFSIEPDQSVTWDIQLRLNEKSR